MAFDIYKGWPFDGAINDNAPPVAGEAIVAGMIVKKNSDGNLIKAVGASGEVAYFAIKDQADLDVQMSNSLPYIVTNHISLTDQFVTGTYVIGDKLEVASGSPGKLQKYTAGTAPIFASFEGMLERDGINFMKVLMTS